MSQDMTSHDSHPILSVRGVSKRFVLHHQHGAVLPVFDRADLDVITDCP